MVEQHLPIGKVAKMVGVRVETIRRWERNGKLNSIRSPGGHRLFKLSEVQNILMCATPKKTCVIYARVSSTKQKADGNLERQVQRLKKYAEEHGYEILRVFQEQASGINENRKQLATLMKMAENKEFSVLLIEFPDRLARFGYKYIERFLQSHDVMIISTHKTEPKSSQAELVDDLLSIITVFSARMYGKRSQEFKQKVKKAVSEMGGVKNSECNQNSPNSCSPAD